MPYYKLANEVPVDHLVKRLVEELRLPGTDLANLEDLAGEQPVIIEEEGSLGRIGVTVIWDEWKDLSVERRGQVIMKAYEVALGIDYVRRIGLAMGLTSAQKQLLTQRAESA